METDYTKINYRISNLETQRGAQLIIYNNRDITAQAAYFWVEFKKSYN